MGILLFKCKYLHKPEWGSCLPSRSRFLSRFRNLWLQQHYPNKIYPDPWFSWMAIYGRALLQHQPSPAFSSSSFSVPLTLAQIQLRGPRTLAMWQCHRLHVVLRDDYLTVISSCNTLSCIKALQLPVVHVTTGTDPSASGFTGSTFLGLARQKKDADYD